LHDTVSWSRVDATMPGSATMGSGTAQVDAVVAKDARVSTPVVITGS
jgi:hypothetical protein